MARHPHVHSLTWSEASEAFMIGQLIRLIWHTFLRDHRAVYRRNKIFSGSLFFGPEEVTQYNIAFKYFGVPVGIYTVLLTPFWSAYTQAFVRGDLSWIRMTFRKLVHTMIWFSVAVVVMVVAADDAYALWIGHTVHIPLSLSAATGAYFVIACRLT